MQGRGEQRRVVRRWHCQLGHQVRAPAPPRRLRVRAALCAVDRGADGKVLARLTANTRARPGPALNSPPAFRSALAAPPLLVGGGRGLKASHKIDGWLVSTSSRRIRCVFPLRLFAALRGGRTPWRRPSAARRRTYTLGARSVASTKFASAQFLEVLAIFLKF